MSEGLRVYATVHIAENSTARFEVKPPVSVVGTTTALVILKAETGPDITVFCTASQVCQLADAIRDWKAAAGKAATAEAARKLGQFRRPTA